MGYALLKEKPLIGQKIAPPQLSARERAASRWFSKEKSQVKSNFASGRIVYNRFRYYDPQLGRYITSDPVGLLVGGFNTYGYSLQNAIRFFDINGLTASCPSLPPIYNSDWKPYVGDPRVFHCGFRGFLEVREGDCDESPIAECFYDDVGVIVDENHGYAGCRGTPDEYPANSPLHIWPDEGGIINSGPEAFVESMQYIRDQLPKPKPNQPQYPGYSPAF